MEGGRLIGGRLIEVGLYIWKQHDNRGQQTNSQVIVSGNPSNRT